MLNALYTLDGLGELKAADAMAALQHANPVVRRHGLRFAERWLDSEPALFDQVLSLTREPDPALLLQLALSLGESTNARALAALASLAREHGEVAWMPNAILSSLHQRGGLMLETLLQAPEHLGAGRALLEPLCTTIGARREGPELASALTRIASVRDVTLQTLCLRGLQNGVKGGRVATITADGHEAVKRLLGSDADEVRQLAMKLNQQFQAADPATQPALVAEARRNLADMKLSPELRLAAVSQLAASDYPDATTTLLAAWSGNTPKIRDAILDAVYSRRDRLPLLLDALENKSVDSRALSAFQRVTLLEHDQANLRERATRLLSPSGGASDEVFRRFAAALAEPRDLAHGERAFRDHCAACHQAPGIGFAVGPDLVAEFQRADEAILKDILAPNETISAGYPTYVVETAAGQTFNGILASESATSVTLRMAAGAEQLLLRKDIARFESLPVSLMPEALATTLEPKDVADVISFLRGMGENPQSAATNRVVLFDEEADFVARLGEGDGRATFETNGAFAGNAFLAVTPPQRYSGRIPGWNYHIAEKPGAGEFRYLRLAWKIQGALGVMIELADDGRWPAAESPQRRYFAGRNLTKWEAREVSPVAPDEWRVVTFDLWKDNGAFTLTGIAPTAMGGTVLFDRIELLRDLSTVGSVGTQR